MNASVSDAARAALATAQAREARRVAATPRVDYKALNELIHEQMRELEAAVAKGDRDELVVLVQKHVRAWNQPGCMWPDDWPRWQNALDTVLPFRQQVDIRDLA